MLNKKAKCEIVDKVQEILQREIADYCGAFILEFHIQNGSVSLLKIRTDQFDRDLRKKAK